MRLRVCLSVNKYRAKKVRQQKSMTGNIQPLTPCTSTPEKSTSNVCSTPNSPGYFNTRQALSKVKKQVIGKLPSTSKRKLQVLKSVVHDLPDDERQELAESTTSISTKKAVVASTVLEAVQESMAKAKKSNTRVIKSESNADADFPTDLERERYSSECCQGP